MINWISVKNGLPADGSWCWVYSSDLKEVIDLIYYRNNWERDEGRQYDKPESITHWQLIEYPEPPCQKSESGNCVPRISDDWSKEESGKYKTQTTKCIYCLRD